MGCLKQSRWLEEGGWRRIEHDPLLPATRLGLSPSVWARDAQSLSSYCLYCSLSGLAGWLVERRKRRWGNNDHLQHQLQDLQAAQSPPCMNLLQGSLLLTWLPAADFEHPPLPPAQCTPVLCHPGNPYPSVVFNGEDLVFDQWHTITCQCN